MSRSSGQVLKMKRTSMLIMIFHWEEDCLLFLDLSRPHKGRKQKEEMKKRKLSDLRK